MRGTNAVGSGDIGGWGAYSFLFIKAYIQLDEKTTFQGIVAKFDLVSPRKNSQILPVFQYNSSVSSQSHDILANYVAFQFNGINVMEH